LTAVTNRLDTQNTVLEKQQGMKNIDAENMQQQKEEETKSFDA
jgi:hypothetical protein